MARSEDETKRRRSAGGSRLGLGIGLGVAIGTAMGVATDNLHHEGAEPPVGR